MKQLFILMFGVLFSIAAQAQSDVVTKYFSNFENNKDFTVVYVSPKIFNKIAKSDANGQKDEVLELVKDIKSLKILTVKKDASKYYLEASKKVPASDYEVLMTVKDDGKNVKFLTKGAGDRIDELVLMIGGADEFVMMSFVGNLDLAKIAKLASKLDIQGSEHLEKLKDKKK